MSQNVALECFPEVNSATLQCACLLEGLVDWSYMGLLLFSLLLFFYSYIVNIDIKKSA